MEVFDSQKLSDAERFETSKGGPILAKKEAHIDLWVNEQLKASGISSDPQGSMKNMLVIPVSVIYMFHILNLI